MAAVALDAGTSLLEASLICLLVKEMCRGMLRPFCGEDPVTDVSWKVLSISLSRGGERGDAVAVLIGERETSRLRILLPDSSLLNSLLVFRPWNLLEVLAIKN